MSTDSEHSPVVPHFEGDTAAFAEILCSTFVELEVTFADVEARIVADLETRTFGDLELVRVSSEQRSFTASRTSDLLAKSVYNSFFVSRVFAGQTSLSRQGRIIELQANDMALLDSSLEYSVRADRPVDLLWIRVPRYRLEGRLQVPAEVMAQRVDGGHGLGRLTSSLLHATFDEAEQVSASHALRVTNALLDLLALSLVQQLQAPSRPISAYRRTACGAATRPTAGNMRVDALDCQLSGDHERIAVPAPCWSARCFA